MGEGERDCMFCMYWKDGVGAVEISSIGGSVMFPCFQEVSHVNNQAGERLRSRRVPRRSSSLRRNCDNDMFRVYVRHCLVTVYCNSGSAACAVVTPLWKLMA